MDAAQNRQHVRHLSEAARLFCTTVTAVLQQSLLDVDSSDMALSQVKLLMLIDSSVEPLTVKEVSEYLTVSTGAASRAVDRVVGRGLVSRTEASSDRRAVNLRLTPAGKDLLDRFAERAEHYMATGLDAIPMERLDSAVDLLEDFAARLHAFGLKNEKECFRCPVSEKKRCLMKDRLGHDCIRLATLDMSAR